MDTNNYILVCQTTTHNNNKTHNPHNYSHHSNTIIIFPYPINKLELNRHLLTMEIINPHRKYTQQIRKKSQISSTIILILNTNTKISHSWYHQNNRIHANTQINLWTSLTNNRWIIFTKRHSLQITTKLINYQQIPTVTLTIKRTLTIASLSARSNRSQFTCRIRKLTWICILYKYIRFNYESISFYCQPESTLGHTRRRNWIININWR